MLKSKLADILHRGLVFSIVGFCAYATLETCFTVNSALDVAKHRMEADKKKKELEEKNTSTNI
ncbi:hypothetical protein K502DRAFT_325947 [Neoconidiobolus thromboides FSU 785]|nr:hypothetical protein K502DRAFT_325947 [Neoconidiobolus thromboides FSU 785]